MNTIENFENLAKQEKDQLIQYVLQKYPHAFKCPNKEKQVNETKQMYVNKMKELFPSEEVYIVKKDSFYHFKIQSQVSEDNEKNDIFYDFEFFLITDSLVFQIELEMNTTTRNITFKTFEEAVQYFSDFLKNKDYFLKKFKEEFNVDEFDFKYIKETYECEGKIVVHFEIDNRKHTYSIEHSAFNNEKHINDFIGQIKFYVFGHVKGAVSTDWEEVRINGINILNVLDRAKTVELKVLKWK